MNSEICKLLAKALGFFSLILCIPLMMGLYFQYLSSEQHLFHHSFWAFFWSLVVSLSASGILYFFGRNAEGQIGRRESILFVGLLWIGASVIGALPFIFSGTLTNPIDALFESASGLTTTGFSVISAKAYNPESGEEIPISITNYHVPTKTYVYYGTVAPIRDPQTGLVLYSGVEAVSRAVLFWRSLLQWFGGMGIVVLFLTVLPALGVGGRFLYQMETTGPFKEEISPRIQKTASKLWKLYLFLTLLQIALLMAFDKKMPLFDAICTSLSTISTGGFSVRNESIMAYTPAVGWIVTLFMVLGSINFSLYFHLLRMKIYRFNVPDLILFLVIAALGALCVSLYLIGQPMTSIEGTPVGTYSIGTAFQQGIFQSISVQSSTGFAIADFDNWPFAAQMILLILMFVGGMSGSSAGGIKTSRFYILYKIILHRLELLYRPNSVRKLHIGTVEIDDSHALTALGFFCIAAVFTVIGSALFIIDGVDPETSFSMTASFLNNVGTAFRAAGPTDSLTFLPMLSKIGGCLLMIFGRLEYYVLLLLFLPGYWRGR